MTDFALIFILIMWAVAIGGIAAIALWVYIRAAYSGLRALCVFVVKNPYPQQQVATLVCPNCNTIVWRGSLPPVEILCPTCFDQQQQQVMSLSSFRSFPSFPSNN